MHTCARSGCGVTRRLHLDERVGRTTLSGRRGRRQRPAASADGVHPARAGGVQHRAGVDRQRAASGKGWRAARTPLAGVAYSGSYGTERHSRPAGARAGDARRRPVRTVIGRLRTAPHQWRQPAPRRPGRPPPVRNVMAHVAAAKQAARLVAAGSIAAYGDRACRHFERLPRRLDPADRHAGGGRRDRRHRHVPTWDAPPSRSSRGGAAAAPAPGTASRYVVVLDVPPGQRLRTAGRRRWCRRSLGRPAMAVPEFLDDRRQGRGDLPTTRARLLTHCVRFAP